MIDLPITLEQLITAIQQLQPSDRAQVAKALIQSVILDEFIFPVISTDIKKFPLAKALH